MKKGFDTATNLTGFADALQASGYGFVARYYNINNPSKNLTAAEVAALSAIGIGIVAVWENGFPTGTAYFNYDKGVHDGSAACTFANQQIGQPAMTPIYFAVDYDASQNDLNNDLSDYFRGISDGFNTAGNNSPQYFIGVYGSGLVCSTLLNSGLVTYAWLAQSSGWAGSRTFSNYNIKQSAQITLFPELGGVTGDGNVSPSDQEGSFTLTQE